MSVPSNNPPPHPAAPAETDAARAVGVSGAAGGASEFGGYQAALKYLYDRIDVERSRPGAVPPGTFKLDRMRALLERLGNPHESLRCVHVAGTKGKGSTCEMAASCLEACGYTVGVYTSPHLLDVRERVRVSRRPIPHADFTRLMGRIASASASIEGLDGPEGGPPTFFEVVTALGFAYFAEQAVDVAVIEVGLGGRLDSTNVITPMVSAITSISLDHTQLLGGTLELIAREKAGIFKPGVPALTVPQKPQVLDVLRTVAGEVGAPLQVLGRDIDFSVRFEAGGPLGPHTRVCLTTARSSFEHLAVPLKGEHQALNCGLALAVLDKLAERGFQVPESKVTRGLEAVVLPGRLETAWPSPRIILDGAHNADSMKCLMKAIGSHVPYDSLVLVFGCCADKDLPGMLEQIALGADKVIFTRAGGTARAADPRDLQRRFTDMCGKMSQTAKDLPEALALAARAVGRDDIICVTGSFYLVGEAKKHLKDLASRRGGQGS